MKLPAKGVGHGSVEGVLMISKRPVSFLGGVNTDDGRIIDPESDRQGESFAGKILAFPHGKGSTVGSYVIYQLKKSGTAPLAIVNQKADPIVATGAIIAEIPMIHEVPMGVLADGDRARVNADEGFIELPDVTENNVVTVIATRNEELLILRRSGKVGSFQGKWAGISGAIAEEESSEEAATREILEETTLERGDYEIIVKGEPILARQDDNIWRVHPFLVEIKRGEIKIDWEHDEFRWVRHEDIDSYETVPKLDEVIDFLLKEKDSTSKKVC